MNPIFLPMKDNKPLMYSGLLLFIVKKFELLRLHTVFLNLTIFVLRPDISTICMIIFLSLTIRFVLYMYWIVFREMVADKSAFLHKKMVALRAERAVRILSYSDLRSGADAYLFTKIS